MLNQSNHHQLDIGVSRFSITEEKTQSIGSFKSIDGSDPGVDRTLVREDNGEWVVKQNTGFNTTTMLSVSMKFALDDVGDESEKAS